jgi:hypothetical protein
MKTLSEKYDEMSRSDFAKYQKTLFGHPAAVQDYCEDLLLGGEVRKNNELIQ